MVRFRLATAAAFLMFFLAAALCFSLAIRKLPSLVGWRCQVSRQLGIRFNAGLVPDPLESM